MGNQVRSSISEGEGEAVDTHHQDRVKVIHSQSLDVKKLRDKEMKEKGVWLCSVNKEIGECGEG